MPCAVCDAWVENQWLEWHGRPGHQFFVCLRCHGPEEAASRATTTSLCGLFEPALWDLRLAESLAASLRGDDPLAALDAVESVQDVPMVVHHFVLEKLCLFGLRKDILRAIEADFNDDEASRLRQLCEDNPDIQRSLANFQAAFAADFCSHARRT